jgi:hypothetical protein
VRVWRRIFRRAVEGGLFAFVCSTGLLLLVRAATPDTRASISAFLLAGLTIAVIWGVAIILIYVVWPEGLGIDKWLRW